MKPLPQSATDAEQILDPALFKSKDPAIDQELDKAKKRQAEESLEIGKPLPFTKKEKHSFGEWLQLTSIRTVKRDRDATDEDEPIEQIQFPIEEDAARQKKFDLIDKFIESDPKISPGEDVAEVDIKSSLKLNKEELMTETLAKVYLEQKKYKKAIQAYKILSLKYPEKVVSLQTA